MKLFFMDIDGTMVSKGKKIDSKLIYAIKNLQSKGNKVIVATGRHMPLINKEIIDIGFDGFVAANGAYIKIGNDEIFNAKFDKKLIEKIIDLTKKNNFIYYLEDKNIIYVNDQNHPIHTNFLANWDIESNFLEDDKKEKVINIAMIAYNEPSDCELIKTEFSEFLDVVSHHGYNSCDLNIKNINKGIGVQKVIDYFKPEISYAFGDGYNDLEMFNVVDKKIAMQNAVQELKEISSEITDSVFDNGIYNYLLKEKLIDNKNDGIIK